MNNSKALLIVDMQNFFFKDYVKLDMLNEKIVEQIREYRKECRPIVILEYRSNPYDPDDRQYGPTNTVIKRELEGYRHLAIFGKDEDGGADFVKAYVDECMFNTGELVLVGVNLDCCVMATAKGLARNHPGKQITILEECCDSMSADTEVNGYKDMLENTVIRVNNCPVDNLRMLVNEKGERT